MTITTINSIERHLCVSHVRRDEEERLHVHVTHYSRPQLAAVLDDVLATGYVPRHITDSEDDALVIVAEPEVDVRRDAEVNQSYLAL